jgi:hypothetical protein
MPKPAEILLERVDARLTELGKTRYWLSMAVTDGKRHGVFTDVERKGFLPSEPRLRRIAEELGTTTDYLMGRTEAPGPLESEVSFHDLPTGWREPGRDGLRLLGTGLCADMIITDDEGNEVEIEQLQLEFDHTIRLIERPAALSNSREAYAIYFQGSSMERRYYQGEIGIVDPSRTPSPGNIVLVQLNDGSDLRNGVVLAIVKELVRSTSKWVELMQYNPERTFRIPRSRVVRMDPVYRPDELLLR